MPEHNEVWLVERITASIGDDYYLDRGEEKGIKEEAASKGFAFRDVERILARELDKLGAVCERVLVDRLDELLHQYTDKDKYLDGAEERDALDKVLQPAPGKKKGLDPRIAKEYVDSFCEVNGVRRKGQGNRRVLIGMLGIAVLAVVTFVAVYIMRDKQQTEPRIVKDTTVVDSSAYSVGETDRAEINDLLRRATQYVDEARYTDPPERSAKACIDRIKAIDPKGQYKGQEVAALIDRIVNEYVMLAQKSYESKDLESTRKWLDRAKLFNKAAEVLREKEREFGLVSAIEAQPAGRK
jgi:hypothetical protein